MYKSILLTLFLVFLLVGCAVYEGSDLSIELNPGIDTVEVNTEFIDAGATATLGRTTHRVTILENTVDVTTVGTYHIIYQTVYHDTVKTLTRKVDVVDQTPPVIELNPGVDTIIRGEIWEDAGVTVTDNSELDVTVTVSGNVINTIAGEYVITYTATDAFGNTSEITRYVHVVPPYEA